MDIEMLVKRAQAGDAAAAAALYERFDGLMNKAASRAHVRALREDALAAARLAFAEAVSAYRPQRQIPFAGFAQAAVRFAVWNLFKKERARWQRECSADAAAADDPGLEARLHSPADVAAQAERNLAAAWLRGQLPALPPRQRAVVRCLLTEDCTLTEAARRLRMTPQAAHRLKQCAEEKLRAAWEGRRGAP